jgi:N-alpha-acetyl-L-2,4-diaminobutyrate deacetylase
VTESPITCTIDLAAIGRQVGRLQVPRSSNTAGWASTVIPIVNVARGEGPSVLVLGGNHGDEYEGQVAALNLARELQPEQVSGRVTIVPVLSVEASRAGTRLWPSGANFNRSFPGSPEGTAAEQLADFLTRSLIPAADVVIDMHSGGTSTVFMVCSHMHVVDDPEQRRRMLDGMLAWNTDHHFLYIDVAGSGLLPVEAERQGKTVVTTELGGGGHVLAETHRVAQDGLANVLRWAGALEGEARTRDDAVILDGRDARNYVFAPESGVFEALAPIGRQVAAGEPIGRIHFIERPDRAPEVIEAPLAGTICGTRAISNTLQGDNVVILGQPIDRAQLV